MSNVAAERTGPGRFSEHTAATRAAAGRGVPADDGIMIIESDPPVARVGSATVSSSQLTAAARSPRGYAARRSTRGRSPATSGGAKPPDTGRPRALTSLVAKSMAETRNRPLQIVPLSSLTAPLSAPLAQLSAAPRPEPPAPIAPPQSFTTGSIRSMLVESGKLRDIIMLSEILQPPRALRHLRRPR
jgi:hypothetical protein